MDSCLSVLKQNILQVSVFYISKIENNLNKQYISCKQKKRKRDQCKLKGSWGATMEYIRQRKVDLKVWRRLKLVRKLSK